MKLVDILVQNWKVWPAGVAVEQTSLGDVFCTTKGRAQMYGTHEIASDQSYAVVTKEQWKAKSLEAAVPASGHSYHDFMEAIDSTNCIVDSLQRSLADAKVMSETLKTMLAYKKRYDFIVDQSRIQEVLDLILDTDAETVEEYLALIDAKIAESPPKY